MSDKSTLDHTEACRWFGAFSHSPSANYCERCLGAFSRPLPPIQSASGTPDIAPELYARGRGFSYTNGAQGWYETRRVRVGGGLSGLLLAVTEGDLDLSERLMHQIGIAAIGRFERAQPGVHLRVPVDENLRDTLDLAIGVSLAVPFQ